MNLTEKIKELAEKVQLEIKEEEMPVYLETIIQLDKLLVDFQQVKLPEKVKPLTRINTSYLTKKELEELTKKFSKKKLAHSELPSYILFKEK
jgi:hypothetical protein